jgi:hypothetical protein
MKLGEKGVIKEFRKHFVYSDDAAVVLSTAMLVGENVVLWGKGGHAKSAMAKKFFELQGITPYVKTLGKGTDIDDFYGGMNVPLYQQKGIRHYNVEDSWMNHEYVIWEEGFDPHMHVLESAKDVLTEKTFRNGSQQFPIKTKMIVICTNRSKSELATNTSAKALLERFQMELEVKWPQYEASDYSNMFSKVLGKSMPEFANMIEIANKSSFISPRSAIKAAKIYDAKGVKPLAFVAGFNRGIVDMLIEQEEELKRDANIKFLLSKFRDFLEDLIKETDALTKRNKDVFLALKCHHQFVDFLKAMNQLRSIPDNLTEEYTDMRTLARAHRDSFMKKVATQTENLDRTVFDNQVEELLELV